ncbi:MAG: hypothetical protein Tsb0019_05260 [Roseibium sp.]
MAVASFLSACAMPVVSYRDGDFKAEKGSALPYALPRGIVQIGFAYDGDKKLTVTGPTVLHVPDPTARFWLAIRGSPAAGDTISVATDASGLLSSVNSLNKDATPEIVKTTVSIVTDLLLARARVAADAASTDGSETEKPERIAPFDVQLSFDPTDDAELGHARAILGATGANATFTIQDFGYVSNASKSHVVAASTPDPSPRRRGLYFRTVRPVGLRVKFGALRFDKTFHTVLPDRHSLAAYDITRKACVESSTDLTFDKGILTSSKLVKPSEILGCLAIPSDIIKAVLGFPILFAQRQKTLTQAELDLLKVQMDLVKLQAEIAASSAVTQ